MITFQEMLASALKTKSIYMLSKESGVSESAIRLYRDGGQPTLKKADRILKASAKN